MPTSKKSPQSEQKESSKIQNPVFDATRKILLAAIGAAALTQDAIEDFVQKLVDRGEIAEKDGKKLIKEISEKRGKSFMTQEREKHFHEVMRKLNIPTRKDIEELNEKVSELTKKIDELKKE